MVGPREANQLSATPRRRLGISVPGDAYPLAELPAIGRRAEALGYTDAWSFEINLYDAFSPLAAVAAVTETMRLGTAIAPVFFRPAGVLAMHAATLAELAPGRFVLGIGSSTPVVVKQWMGVPFSRPVTRTREMAVAVRALLAGERVGALRLGHPPAVPPPIWMAALGERMRDAAREVADGVCLFMVGPRLVPELVGSTDSMCRVTVVPGEGPEARAAARRLVTGYAIVPFYARVMERQGFVEEVRGINERWAAGDRSGAVAQVSDAMLDELVLTGSPDRIRAGLERYWAAGLGCPVLAIASTAGDPSERRAEHDRVLEALAAR